LPKQSNGSDQGNKENQIDLGDYIDLTITQIIILFLLRVYPHGTIRFTIFQELNRRLSVDDKISPSSFYNSIKKLEKKKLISCQRNENGQITRIKIKPKTDLILNQAGQTLILGFMDFRKNVIPQVLPYYKEIIGVTEKPYESLLVISSEMTYDRMFTITDEIAKNVHAIVYDEVYDIYYKGGTDFIRTEILHKKIREPNDTFDLVIISPYFKADSFFGLSRENLLQEALRVIKPNGRLIIITGDKLPQVDHILIELFINMISSTFGLLTISEEELKKDFEAASILNYEISSYKGFLITAARKVI